MCQLSPYVAFNKATDGQTDIKQGKVETLIAQCHCQWIELRCAPPPSRRPGFGNLQYNYAENLHIVLSCPYLKEHTFIFNLLCVLICVRER